jgi:protein arginine N-methyltransferase 1
MNGAAAHDKVSELDGDAPESTDFANYFCAYAYIYHQVCFWLKHVFAAGVLFGRASADRPCGRIVADVEVEADCLVVSCCDRIFV